MQDIAKWILISIGFAIVFILTKTLTAIDDNYIGPVIITFLVSRGSYRVS